MAKDLVVKILGDAKGALAAINETDGALSRFGPAVLGATAAIGAAGIAAGVALYNIGSTFDDVSDTIRVQTGATGEALAGLESSFENVFTSVPASSEDAAAAIATLNQKLGLTGPELEALSTQALNLSRITGDDLAPLLESSTTAFQNWGLAAADQGPALDTLYRISQDTGLGVADLSDKLAKAGEPLRQFGFSFEESAALVGNLTEAGLDADKVLAGLGKGLVNVAKDGEEPIDTLSRVSDAILAAKSDTEAAGIAAELFGAKAGPEMAAAIRAGTLSIEDLNASLAGTDTINQAAEDTADFAEQWTLFKNQTMVALAPLAEKVFGGIGAAMAALAPAMKPIIDGFVTFVTFVSDNIAYIAAFALGVTAALVPAFIAWATTAGAAAIATLTAAAPLIAVGAAVAALAAGVIWAYQNVDWFRTSVDAVASFLRDTLWPIIKTVALWIGTNLVAAVQSVAGFFTGTLIPAVSGVIGWFGDLIGKAIEVHQGITSGFDILVGFITGLPDRIASAASGMFDGIKEAFRSAINFIIDKWNGLSFSLPSVDTPFGNVGGFTLDTPNLRRLHTGGIVPGVPGQEVPVILLAGETVRTSEQEAALNRRSGIVIENLYMTERPLLEELTELEARYGMLV